MARLVVLMPSSHLILNFFEWSSILWLYKSKVWKSYSQIVSLKCDTIWTSTNFPYILFRFLHHVANNNGSFSWRTSQEWPTKGSDISSGSSIHKVIIFSFLYHHYKSEYTVDFFDQKWDIHILSFKFYYQLSACVLFVYWPKIGNVGPVILKKAPMVILATTNAAMNHFGEDSFLMVKKSIILVKFDHNCLNRSYQTKIEHNCKNRS